LVNCEVVPEPPRVLPQPRQVAPLAPKRFALQVTIGQETRDKLRRLQDLLGHSLPSGDVGQVLDKAFRRIARETRARQVRSCRPAAAEPLRSGAPTRGMSLPTSSERSGNAMAAGAPSSATQGNAVRSTSSSNTTMSSRSRAAAGPP